MFFLVRESVADSSNESVSVLDSEISAKSECFRLLDIQNGESVVDSSNVVRHSVEPRRQASGRAATGNSDAYPHRDRGARGQESGPDPV